MIHVRYHFWALAFFLAVISVWRVAIYLITGDWVLN